MKLILLITVVLIPAVIFTVIFHQRQDEDTLMELVYWPGIGAGFRGNPAYYFIVKNDGTFISYQGFSRFDSWQGRTRNFLRWRNREREQITLSEEDFLYISERVDNIVTGHDDMRQAWTSSVAKFIHNGKIYENSTVWSGPLFDLVDILFELTPLDIRWN